MKKNGLINDPKTPFVIQSFDADTIKAPHAAGVFSARDIGRFHQSRVRPVRTAGSSTAARHREVGARGEDARDPVDVP
jgi:hypothetical protein